MPRWMIALALLAAPVWAQGEPEDVPDEEIVGEKTVEDVPGLPAGRIARGERDAPAVSVRLREGGVLQVMVGEEWKETKLKDLSALLKTSAEDYDREMQKTGKSGYDAVGTLRLSRLFVSIDAEPTVPWQHIQWLMAIAAEQKYPKFELSDGTRRLLAFLPVDRGIHDQPAEPPHDLKVVVHVVCRAERPGKWGDIEVNRPAEVLYRFGNEESRVLPPAADYVRKAWAAIKDTKGARLIGEVKAGHKAPFGSVFDVIETFEAAGFTNLNFYGTAIPTPELRDSPRLPYPAKNYDTPD